MSDYYHLYKGRRIEFERESAFDVQLTKNIPNKFINNFKNDFLNHKIPIKSISKHNYIVFKDSDKVEAYLERKQHIKTYKNISLLKYDGVYYRETNTEDYYEYIVAFKDQTLKIDQVLLKINQYNQSSAELVDSAGGCIFLIKTSMPDLKLPEDYSELIFLEKNIFTIGSYESDDIDPRYSIQNIEEKPYCQPFAIIKVNEAHHYIKQNISINYKPRIALLDNGVFYKHYELASSVNPKLSKNYINNGDITPAAEDLHGTACAGIIGAVKYNDRGFDGIATGSEIIAYKICEGNNRDNFFSSNFSIIKAFFDSAFITKCDVISCSFSLNYECIILENLIVKIASEGRKKLGIPIIFSAGNENEEIKFPQTIPNVFTIAASNLQNEPHKSNFGKNVLVSAPGENVVTTNLPDIYGQNNIELNGTHYYNYTYFEGTSASAPIVAGLIGLMLQVNPKLHLKDIKALIKAGSEPLQNNTSHNYGCGVVNILNTINHINLNTRKMSTSKLNLTGNVVLGSTENHNQFIYGSQLYGTNFGIFCDFIVKKPDSDKKECKIISATVSIINYKGILDLGFLDKPTLELKEYQFGVDEKEIALVMDIKLQAVVAGASTYSQKVSIDIEDDLINEDHLFVVKRELIKLNDKNLDNPIVKGVFENEFYYRDGLRYAERQVTEVPEEYYYQNTNQTYPDDYPLEYNKPSAKCANAINTLTII